MLVQDPSKEITDLNPNYFCKGAKGRVKWNNPGRRGFE